MKSTTASLSAGEKNFQSKHDKFLATYLCHQEWSLPDSVIYYITKNPLSSKCYGKMIQSCKHFFVQNPLLVVPSFSANYRNNEWNTFYNSVAKNKCIFFNNIASKIWITDRLHIANWKSLGSLSSLVPRIYKFPKIFELLFQNISFNDLMFFASKCESIRLSEVNVMNDDGSIVTLEELFESFPNINRFIFGGDRDNPTAAFTSNTVQNLLKVPHFSTLKELHLADMPEIFDIECFYDYIKQNKKTKIFLTFCDQISEQFKIRLQEIVDEILATENRDYMLPYIGFDGNDVEAEYALSCLFHCN